jgi:hypothetical protein
LAAIAAIAITLLPSVARGPWRGVPCVGAGPHERRWDRQANYWKCVTIGATPLQSRQFRKSLGPMRALQSAQF